MSWSEQVWKGHCPDNLVAMLPDALHDNVASLDANFAHILERFLQRCMAMSFSDRLLDGLDHLGGHTSELQDSLLSQQLQPLDAREEGKLRHSKWQLFIMQAKLIKNNYIRN